MKSFEYQSSNKYAAEGTIDGKAYRVKKLGMNQSFDLSELSQAVSKAEKSQDDEAQLSSNRQLIDKMISNYEPIGHDVGIHKWFWSLPMSEAVDFLENTIDILGLEEDQADDSAKKAMSGSGSITES